MTAAVAGAGLLLVGCGDVGSGGACPMWRGIPTITVDAAPYVRAHPGRATTMRVCLVDVGNACDAASAAGRSVAVNAQQAVFRLGHLDSGTYRVRVVLADTAGHSVLDTTGKLVVHHTDGGRCKNLVGDHGTSRVDAGGRITTT
ncbi:hypothetical protein SAMN05216267_10874 [Actinacidiphila rubida]|uniref:Uncharacterized protein n=2 Tax=Actinacidiphila rubida TaxID=310780 RepID=A0A1H8UUM8_9ACTN|nr:hypothetical protein [Actinacidiphila rubida]SEP06912.1 hypothetical protein SAMN05216267_10874 [Actinacidiphila rubida]